MSNDKAKVLRTGFYTSQSLGDKGCIRIDFKSLAELHQADDELRAFMVMPAQENQGEPVCWVNDQQLLLCSKSPRVVEPDNPMMHNLPRNIAGSALQGEYCNTPLFRNADTAEVIALRGAYLRAGEREHELRTELAQLRAALKFYADRDHYSTDDGSNWDSCSGEPANILWHESEPWFIEDGSIARAALAISAERGSPNCATCNGEGAVGNILDTVPCPDCAAAPPADPGQPTDLATWKRRAVEAESKLRTYDPKVLELSQREVASLLVEPRPSEMVLMKCVLCDQLQADLTARDQQIDALRQGMNGDYDLDAWLAFVEEVPQLRLDAGRYRWLRDSADASWECWFVKARGDGTGAGEADREVDDWMARAAMERK